MSLLPIEFEKLTEKHGAWASWAIWEYEKSRIGEKSTDIIYSNIEALNVRNVIIGLNISNGVEVWGNFRGGKHDRKLKYAFNDTAIRGAYMTDLFRIKMKESTSLAKELKINPELIPENVLRFVDEMRDLKITSETRFILMGTEESVLGKYYRREFQKYFKDNPVTYHRHYSSRGTDKTWVESMRESLNINGNFDEILLKYKVKD
ncbi:hypothetical protein [Pedobacter gandavensis]|uniref:hypothetical protein n=1 Tax=Pedobacter gandavensis TaxID=2679963 RepID=UPI00292FB326|nr:hypothetical protein [Pedobacter gandavensis]